MEVKRKEEKEGMASGDADSIWDGRGGKREKPRARLLVAVSRGRGEGEEIRVRVCSFPRTLHSVWFVRAIGIINLLLLFILAPMLLNLVPIKVALLTHIECSSK